MDEKDIINHLLNTRLYPDLDNTIIELPISHDMEFLSGWLDHMLCSNDELYEHDLS